ncbi:chaplin [Streptomyces aurantiacus]|uniref:Chaplin n=1 Tax=Streptomyces aurantiacus TaxID=47760 RepID=A0A7G1P9R8_9ACTN|nr:chaplin [Streptomyces aurantiacus]BCL30530.1 hypothetical protein GCM10017557_53890 [Streptomyces aurantiacus]
MRQTLSKGMVVAAAATSILSLYGSQAFADSNADGVAADSPGVLSGNSVGAPVDVPVNACGNSANVVAGLNPAFGNSCATPTGKHRKPATSGHEAPAGHGSDHGHAHGSDHGDGSGHHGSGHHGSRHQGSGHHGSDHRGSGHHGSGDHDSGHHDSRHHDSGHHGGGSVAHGETHGSPGVGAGNSAAVPVGVPVNACGNSVDVIGLLNPVFGNKCAHHDGPMAHGDAETPPTGHHPSTPPAQPPTATTPPSAPPTTGPSTTVPPTTRPPTTRPPVTTLPATTLPATAHAAEGSRPQLAHTGSDGMLAASAAGAGLLLGGAVLYRRNRAASRW